MQSRAVIILILLAVLIVVCFKFSIHEKWQSNQIHKLESQLAGIRESIDTKTQQVKVDFYRNANDFASYANGIIIASKGGEGLGCPPNSVMSILEAYKQGYDAFRMNVCKTKDGVYVLSHDRNINKEARNIDGSEILEEILIEEHTLSELNQYDFGIKYGEDFAGLQIATFEDCVKTAAGCGMRLDIEWKFPNAEKEDFENIYKTIVTNGYSNKNWHWITDSKEGVDWFKSICDYVNIEIYIDSVDNINWELLEYASSPNHDVVVGYWRSGMDDDVIVELRKHNIIQNRGTAGSVEAMASDLEQGVTELECCFPYPREALMKYIEEGN